MFTNESNPPLNYADEQTELTESAPSMPPWSSYDSLVQHAQPMPLPVMPQPMQPPVQQTRVTDPAVDAVLRAGGGYTADDLSRSTWILNHKDKQGHSAQFNFSAPDAFKVAINNVIRSRGFPYQTEASLLLHALDRHLRWLNRQGPACNLFGQLDAIIAVAQAAYIRDSTATAFTDLSRSIERTLKLGALNDARRDLQKSKALLDELPADDWRVEAYVKWQELYDMYVTAASNAMVKRMAASAGAGAGNGAGGEQW